MSEWRVRGWVGEGGVLWEYLGFTHSNVCIVCSMPNLLFLGVLGSETRASVISACL